MTMRRTVVSLSLLFSTVMVSMVILTSPVRANTKSVTFNEPVMIGSTVLEAGTYKVSWTGSESAVMVAFMKKGQTVATASARLVLENSRRRAIGTKTMPDNSRILTRLSFKNETLFFNQSSGTDEST